MPKALLDRPELDLRQNYYYSAFNACSRSRGASMGGALNIPVSEILSYCNLFYITQIDERERLFRFVNSLDSAYLEHVNAKSKSKS